MTKITAIRDLAWSVLWEDGAQRYKRGSDLVFDGDALIHVSGRYDGKFDSEIDGSSLMAMPGFVNVHGHLGTETLGKGFFEELGSHKLQMSRIYEYIYTMRPDAASTSPATQFAIAELMKSGCTTIADMATPYDGWLETIAATGVRGYLAPMFRAGTWFTPNDHSVEYRWDDDFAERGMATAFEICLAAREHPSGRMGGIVMPAQVETCPPDLLRTAHAKAREHDLPFQIHACQSVHEFNEIVRRHGKTPIEVLEDAEVLGPTTTVAHGIFIDEHPAIGWHEKKDLQRLVRSGSNLVHCPVTFAYRGVAMNTLGHYREAGIHLAIGTDTFPHDFLNEMRLALMISKVMSRHVDQLRLSHLFEMATIGGARVLGRDDIGRLAVNAKADVVLVDLSHPGMIPARDPLRSLVFSAGSAAVRHVFVDGQQTVKDFSVVTVDVAKLAKEVELGQKRALTGTPSRDWARRSADEISPLALPIMQ
jgi:5-methylthioadenosine/S-adenosylhomocysteine deaminase